MNPVRPNSPYAWILAARPKTLAASSVPVIVASALAAHSGQFRPIPALLCLLFALFAQVAANFSNDYFDFIKETDTQERLGPDRAVISGWITPRNMLVGTAVAIALACLAGSGLIPYGGWSMLGVGVVCVLALLAYTAGPWPLAYHGLGDLFVLIFFGLVAVVFTFYVQARAFPPLAFVTGLMVGLAAVNILVVNNVRDYETDKASSKNTSIVLLGRSFGTGFYLTNGILICLLALSFAGESLLTAFLPWLYLPFHLCAWKKMRAIGEGSGLNVLIGETARNLMILGLLVSAGLVLG
jgi:1,4-dihydroxy-2-naphthoate octaprenyltransferase